MILTTYAKVKVIRVEFPIVDIFYYFFTSQLLFVTVKKLFAQRRKDHIEAVQTLLKMDNYERLYKMIAMLAEKVVEVIESSKSVLKKADFLQHNSSFPEDTNVKDGMIIYLQIAESVKSRFRKVSTINFIIRMSREYDGRLSAETEQNLPFCNHVNNYKMTDCTWFCWQSLKIFLKILHVIFQHFYINFIIFQNFCI